jgi:hypothetical protein
MIDIIKKIYKSMMVLRKEDCVSLPTDAYSISFVGVLPTIGNIPPRQLAN